MSGIFFSEEDRYSLNDLQITSMGLGISLSLICSVILFIFSRFFAGLYLGYKDASTLSLGSEGVKMIAFALPLRVFLYCFINYLQGVKKFKTANVLMAIMVLVAPVSIMSLWIRIFAERGVWLSVLGVDLILSVGFLVFILLQKGSTFKEKRLFIGDRIPSGEKEMEFVIDTMTEVAGVSGIAMLFCMENGFSKPAAGKIALFVEEMCKNIIQHGFREKGRNLILSGCLPGKKGLS